MLKLLYCVCYIVFFVLIPVLYMSYIIVNLEKAQVEILPE